MPLKKNKEISSSEFIDDLSRCKTNYDIFHILKEVTECFGYERFIIIRLPDNLSTALSEHVVITNWDPELILSYDRMKFLECSEIIASFKTSVLPILWRFGEIHRSDAREKEVENLFSNFGIHNGVALHLSGICNNKAVVDFSGKRNDLTEDEIMHLSYLTQHVYDKLIQVSYEVDEKNEILTDRERECISWTAVGKTSSEVGIILGISENTVNHYLASAALKLDTVNKAHTVAKAIRNGFITS